MLVICDICYALNDKKLSGLEPDSLGVEEVRIETITLNQDGQAVPKSSVATNKHLCVTHSVQLFEFLRGELRFVREA